MKKGIVVVIALLFAFAGMASAQTTSPEVLKAMAEPIKGELTADTATVLGGSSYKIVDVGNEVEFTIYGVELTPAFDTKGKGHFAAKTIKMASGIRDAAKQDRYFKVLPVVNNTVTFRIPNYAKTTGVPTVETLWGIGEGMNGEGGHLVLNHMNQWVAHKTKGGQIDMNQLAIAVVMYPDAPTVPVTSLKKGWINQGKHPDLAKK